MAEFYKLSRDNDDDAGWLKMTEELQYVLTDPVEVGRWLYCKQRQYSDIKSLKALHGADYQKQARDTTEMHTRVCEAIFLQPDFEYVRSELLFQLYKANGGANKSISFHRLVGAWLEQHADLGISYETAWPWHELPLERLAQARVYIKNPQQRPQIDGKRQKLNANDRDYGDENNGRWTFYVDVI